MRVYLVSDDGWTSKMNIQQMVKPKQRNNRGKKLQNQDSPKDDEDWMMVKKQIITIIIPPLPNKKQLAMPSVGEAHLQEKPRNPTISRSPTKPNSYSQCLSANSASNHSIHESEKSHSSEEQPVQPPTLVPPPEPNLNLEKPSNVTTSSDPPLLDHSLSREGNTVRPCGSRKGIKVFAHNTSFLNQRMRASYLEKKLKRAGGLENWLVSLGLARFVKVFESRRVGKFQLANLTMQKLKEMGTVAVGPRRKLMHAIDCLCVPHCFQHV